jgi:phosphate transport system permease protein
MADAPTPADRIATARARRLRARYAAERRFRWAALGAVTLSVGFLLLLLGSVLAQGLGGFVETRIALPLDLRAARLPVTAAQLRGRGADLALASAGLDAAVDAAADRAWPSAGGAAALSPVAWKRVRDALKRDPTLLGRPFTLDLPASAAIDAAVEDGRAPPGLSVSRGLDLTFLTASDATDPAAAGIWGALKGSLLAMAVTLGLALPIGIAAAIWLEEFAPRTRWSGLIEVSVNNLAAVPSILFGLFGLAVFLGAGGLPRSAPLVAGLTLALMTLPVIVIAARAALTGVPGELRDAALGVGASRTQVVFGHVLPLAAPGVLTGAILGAARALGETAPLLLIGMRAFIAAPPADWTAPATTLPVQIFLWSDQVGRGFVEKTSAAILVLLVALFAMNGVAIALRGRYERRA